MQLPRGPIKTDSGGLDLPDNYTSRMLSWREEARTEANRFRELSPENERVRTYMKYIEGDHWAQFGRRPVYKSSFYTNKVGNARMAHLALHTDAKPEIEIGSDIPQFEPIASILGRVMRKEWSLNRLDLSLVTTIDIAGTAGTGFWKLGAASPGMMRVVPCGPDMVMPIQPGFSIQESTAVLYRTYKSMTEALVKFPNRRDELSKQGRTFDPIAASAYHRPDHLDEYTWQKLAPQMRRLVGRKVAVPDAIERSGFFQSIEWQEFYIDDPSINESRNDILMKAPDMDISEHNWWYWVKPGERLYPRKRLVVFGGDVILYDGPSPYWHGLYPFATLKLNPVFWSFWGLSRYRDMLPVNSAINEVVAGVLDAIKRAINPTLIGKSASISKAAWDQFFPDMPGAKLYLTGSMANPATDLRYSDPPQIPAYVFQLLANFLGPEFDKLAGMLDIANLGGKHQVPGGDTIEQMRDSMQSNPRFEGRMLEAFLTDAGVQSTSNILQFYTAGRRMALLGNDALTFADFDADKDSLVPEKHNKFSFWKNFPFTVVPGSMHGGAKDREKLMAIQLFSAGALSRKKLLEILEVTDISDEELAMERAKLAGAGLAPPGGGDGGGMPRLSRGQRNGSPV